MAKNQASEISVIEADSAKENREYKDSVFRDLFYSDITAKENQIALYNALHGTGYSADSIEIEKISLENILYMNFN